MNVKDVVTVTNTDADMQNYGDQASDLEKGS